MPTMYGIKGAGDFSGVPVNRDFLNRVAVKRVHMT